MAGELGYRFMFPQKGEDNVLTKPNFIFEPKIDGVRVFVQKENNSISLINRKGEDITNKYPELRNVWKNILTDSCVLDAELTVLNRKGFPDMELLQQREQQDKRIEATPAPAVLFVFDIVDIDGIDLTGVPLDRRKAKLKKIIRESFNFKMLLFSESGTELYKRITELGIKGIIAKDVRSKYDPSHSFFWLKIEPGNYSDSFIIGYIKDKEIDSLLLVLANYKNDKIVYTGTSKLPQSMSKSFEKLVKKLKTKESVLNEDEEKRAIEGSKLIDMLSKPEKKQKKQVQQQATLKPESPKKKTRKRKIKPTWLKPELVAEINRPSMKFMRLRFDKKHQACILEY